jgi:hypothetical protein
VRKGSRIVGLFCVLLTAGCVGIEPAPLVAPSPAISSQTGAETAVPSAVPAAPPRPSAPTATQSGATAVEPARAPATPSTSASAGPRDTKAAPPAAKAPPPASPTQVTKNDSAPPHVATQKAPPLDLASLEARLKETKAIGVLTKIAISNQVDDLLNQFRDFYQGKFKTTLAELRRPYDLLVLKVLALLQDSDPALASAIVASREAIWDILSDRTKFAAI